MIILFLKIKVHANLKSVNTQFSQQLNNMNLRSKTTEKAVQEKYSQDFILNTHKMGVSNREF